MRRVFWATLAAAAMWSLGACSGSGIDPTGSGASGSPDTGFGGGPAPTPDASTPDASAPDAGGGGGFDSGVVVDAGLPDAGHHDGGDAGADAGTDAGKDAGTDAGPPDNFPTIAGWTFYGTGAGGPSEVYGVTADQGGNIWVAGGQDGLFLLKPGATRFQRFGLKDGLHPYGFMPDGGPATTTPYLKVLSVSGGPAGTVFVGYAGKPAPAGQDQCEDNWDGANPDPDIYKSGDADRVTLSGNGISVVHYDIFSGPNIVPNETRGREKLCNIWTIRYEAFNNSVWFGGNHGFAWGDATFAGNTPGCDGQLNCSGLWEHSHPAFSAFPGNDPSAQWVWMTDDYRGVAVDPATHDVWMGGVNRSTKFRYETNGRNYWAAQALTECSNTFPDGGTDWGCIANRIDVWPDAVGEPNVSLASQRTDDLVSGIAGQSDGTAWVGSGAWGLAHLDANGHVLGYLKNELISANVSTVSTDTDDGSIWVGHRWGGGISRVQNGQVVHYDYSYFGATFSQSAIADIQMLGQGANRQVLVGFQQQPHAAAGIGVYSGR